MRRTRHERGVALVMTLIFLSVITVMAVAFLALTRRGKVAVRENTNRTLTERMTDIALERAKAEIRARILSSGNPDFLGPQMMVSVNDTNFLVTNPYYDADGQNQGEDIDTLTNLYFDPRVPVVVDTNRNGIFDSDDDFRYYLDLNRNERPDPSGWIQVVDDTGTPVLDPNSGNPIYSYEQGDPEWVGALSDPMRVHSQGNKFIGRWCYLILPASRGLDLNAVHNEAKRLGWRGFYRNQGVGPWELNFAAFLSDLNTNIWFGYDYTTDLSASGESRDLSFTDATALLYQRYMGIYTNLSSFEFLFPDLPGHPRATTFAEDFIDGYSDSPLTPFGIFGADEFSDPDAVSLYWPGAPNRTNFFTPHDLFGPALSPEMVNFVNRLRSAGYGQSTYDRYTYYRMLSQVGTDSDTEPEIREGPRDKINLNYLNVPADNIVQQRLINGVPVWHSPTNFLSWTPTEFFNTVANEMVRKEFSSLRTNLGIADISLTNYPVFVNGSTRLIIPGVTNVPLYHPRLHQILQLSANICDATRADKAGEAFPYLPTVYRPVVEITSTNDIYLRGYVELDSAQFYANLKAGLIKWWSMADPNSRPPRQSNGGFGSETNFFYELPFIVGAKKGFPNFNEYAVQTSVQVSRKLELVKSSPGATPNQTNQMFIMGISNTFAIEAWYSYTNGLPTNYYPRRTEMFAATSISSTLTNDFGFVGTNVVGTNFSRILTDPTVDLTQAWGGSSPSSAFQIFGPATQIVLTNSVYRPTAGPPGGTFEPVGPTNVFDNTGIYTNQWTLTMTNRLLYFLFDLDTPGGPYIVDAVALNDLQTQMNVSRELSRPGQAGSAIDNAWDTSLYRGTMRGLYNQWLVGMGITDADTDWLGFGMGNPASGTSKNLAIDAFRYFVDPSGDLYPMLNYTTNELPPLGLRHQVPFSPTRKVIQTTSWQANDPIVHYTVEDLQDSPGGDTQVLALRPSQSVDFMRDATTGATLGRENSRYSPWGGRGGPGSGTTSGSDYNPAIKDPGMFGSDGWQFPDQKFATIGWLGRVHRGTPWQTIYLKSGAASASDWLRPNGPGFDMMMHPTNDYRLVDMFTTAISSQMTRGRLSINQTNLASWSAALAAMPVTTLDVDGNGNPIAAETLIEPAEVGGPDGQALLDIVAGITRVRANNGPFRCLSEILNVPELTTDSPYLRDPFVANATALADRDLLLYDSDYERIPQQILSLLEVGEPRFVIYAFGQSLTPSDLVPGGPALGMPINYRITGELATRTVVRVEYETLSDDPYDPNYNLPNYARPHLVVEQFNILPPY